jgi:hypothetical protein
MDLSDAYVPRWISRMSRRVITHALTLALMIAALPAGAALADWNDVNQFGRPSKAQWYSLKRQAAARAGISWQKAHNFELDHIQPCCLERRCDNSLENLQMTPCDAWDGPRCIAGAAFDRDVRLEAPICRAVHEGRMTMPEAKAKFKREWP